MSVITEQQQSTSIPVSFVHATMEIGEKEKNGKKKFNAVVEVIVIFISDKWYGELKHCFKFF